jgi:chromosome segregation ATPase
LIVSVIPQTPPPASLLQPFHETAQELANGCAQYEQALTDLFCDVDRMRRELELHLQAVIREQCELRSRQVDLSVQEQDSDRDTQRLRSELDLRDLQLTKAHEELRAAREELERERHRACERLSAESAPCDHAEQFQRLQESLDSACAERDTFQSERDSWRELAEQNSVDHGAELARLGQELADVRGALAVKAEELVIRVAEWNSLQSQLAETRDQLTETRERLADAQGLLTEANSRLGDVQGQLMDARGQLAETQKELTETRAQLEDAHRAVALATDNPLDSAAMTNLAQEREALEAELELVRSQTAELHETVRQQQYEMVTQKSELGGELQQLRRLVEKQADLIADRAVQTGRDTVAQTVAAGPDNVSLPNDPVVNSVMAQFAKLQKDVAQRRRRKQ